MRSMSPGLACCALYALGCPYGAEDFCDGRCAGIRNFTIECDDQERSLEDCIDRDRFRGRIVQRI